MREEMQLLSKEASASMDALWPLLMDGHSRIGQQSPALEHFAGSLSAFVAERGRAICALVHVGQLWDAEILVRCAFEATLRCLFVCHCDDTERRVRLREYYDHLTKTHELRQSARARSLLEQRRSRSSETDTVTGIFDALILDRAVEDAIRAEWPKARRQRLEQKWSIPNIVAELDQVAASAETPLVFSALMHSYGVGSHLIHADSTGIGLIHDRIGREADEHRALCFGHAARVLSDIVSFLGRLLIGFAAVVPLREGWKAELGEVMLPFSKTTRQYEEAFYRELD